MLKVAIVGCGKIADSHVFHILRRRECEIVGVCDCERLMAKQLCERFPVRRHYSDVGELWEATRPDVVHITTPPESHYALARFCIEQGSHVYVEKPFTLDAEQALRLVDLAERKGVKLTVGHIEQFTHAALRMRELIRDGYLGGGPLHMESHYGYDLGDPSYAKGLLGDPQHWVRRLPGKLLQNVMSHGIARIAEYLAGDSPQVIAHAFVSPFLERLGEREIVDELRVIVFEEQGVTAYFTFSTQIRPSAHLFRIFGPKNGLILDQDHDTVLALRGSKFKSYADKFIPPVIFAKQHLGNLAANVRLFLARDFHMDSGMKHLIDAFYRSVEGGAVVPIPYREILLTARIMDSIFAQLGSLRLDDHVAVQAPPAPLAKAPA